MSFLRISSILLFALVFSSCQSGKMEVDFSEKHAWVQEAEGEWTVVPIGDMDQYDEAYPGIRNIKVHGYTNAKRPAELLYDHPQLSLSTGIPRAPPTASEKAFGRFIQGVFALSGMAVVAGGFFMYGGRRRAAVFFLVGGLVLAVMGVLLIRFNELIAEAPMWQWVLAAVIVAVILGTGIGEVWGEKVEEKKSKKAKDAREEAAAEEEPKRPGKRIPKKEDSDDEDPEEETSEEGISDK